MSANDDWPLWPRDEPAELARYVQTGVFSRLLPSELARELPGPSREPPSRRLERLYRVFEAAEIRYTPEPTSGSPEKQAIRPPDQVLVTHRHADCLDLAVTFAGACLDAALHPVIVILDPAGPGRPRHAIVVVWLGGDWRGEPDPSYPLADVVTAVAPRAITSSLRTSAGTPGRFAAIDVVAAASLLGEAGEAPQSGFAAALAGGERAINGDAWIWAVGVDIGRGHNPDRAHRMLDGTGRDPLVAPYLDMRQMSGEGPLRQVRARHGVVEFHPRDELDHLLEWCHQPAPERRVKMSVVHGVGGAGKTHLAAELCLRLRTQGWYTGFLPRDPDPASLRWLGAMVSPVLVVVDYAEAARAGDVIALVKAMRRKPEGDVCILLMARGLGEWWEDHILDPLRADGLPHKLLAPIRLPDRHPNMRGVFRYACNAFTTSNAALTAEPPQPETGTWTTLDLVMLAWLTAHGVTSLPTTRQALHQEILGKELVYWRRTIHNRLSVLLPRNVLTAIGACVSLLAPSAKRLANVIDLVNAWRWKEVDVQTLAGVFHDLLLPDPDDGTLAVRPDPMADYLVLSTFGTDIPLFLRSLGKATKEEQVNALLTLTRAAWDDPNTAARLTDAALRHDSALLLPALAVASMQGGVLAESLARTAETAHGTQDLEDLEARTPHRHGSLRRFGLIAAERLYGGLAEDETAERRATGLRRLARRALDSGRREQALRHISDAVDLYRRLAADGSDHTRELASALDDLATAQSETGLSRQALDSAQEAVALRRRLIERADQDDMASLRGLIASLNGLGNQQSEHGLHEDALRTISEAANLQRDLADADPTRLPDLGTVLNTLSSCQAALLHAEDALRASTEAVAIHRQLARDNPATFLPALSASLNNLALRQSHTGDLQGALASSAECLSIRRRLANDDVEAFRSDLAIALDNHAVRLKLAGRWQAAAHTASEAVDTYRCLAGPEPAAFQFRLAGALNNLGAIHAELEHLDTAADALDEATAIYRDLAASEPAAFEADLGMALNNLALVQSGGGNLRQAISTMGEAVHLRRRLAEETPAHLDGLASSLSNLAKLQCDIGDHHVALRTGAEATAIYRRLTAANSGYSADLAASLGNLSAYHAHLGDRPQALELAREAVLIRHRLAETDPATHLPGLAQSLNNLAMEQASMGLREEALSTVESVVDVRRALVAQDPVRHEPALASALLNLAIRQAATGRSDAVITSQKAVDIYRKLREGSPHSYADQLARALNNLSNRQAAAEMHEEALRSAKEAVLLHRSLAGDDPGAAMDDLAGALNNLAMRQATSGWTEEALGNAAEAVRMYRRLADERPSAHTPTLAKALGTLAEVHAQRGDLIRAVAFGQESAALRRRLAEAEPTAFTSDLVAALHDLAGHLLAAGRPAQAADDALEAVRLCHRLARGEPQAFLSDLAASLSIMEKALTAQGRRAEGEHAFEGVLATLPTEYQARLLVLRARGRLRDGLPRESVADLERAVAYASTENDPSRAAQTYRRIRALAQVLLAADGAPADLANRLPGWAVVPVPVPVREVLEHWSDAGGDERERLLRAHHARLSGHEADQALRAVEILCPDDPAPGQLRPLLAAIADQGLEAALADDRAARRHQTDLAGWLATATWTESFDHLRAHPGLLGDPRTIAVLQVRSADPAIAQHLAIVRLCARYKHAEVYDIVTDPTIATHRALQAAEIFDAALLDDVLTAAPDLAELSYVAPYLQALKGLLDGNSEGITEALGDAAVQGTAIQRASGAARLRRMADQRPDASSALLQAAKTLAADPVD
ncbi:tetratricopeptide repeat protein [Nonomuraea guangzhouensis]|uniref:Tetratricopeptide repeat protein n=1 Tax=Nonomuraea guangzhouensis TaxID=1291555 RepID=A0ABW4GK73_9ACTN|nr:tetratricopeptide repeat protein [Nonomuraea guangzhouensis]